MNSEGYEQRKVILSPPLRARFVEGWRSFASTAHDMASDAEYASDEALVNRVWKVRRLLISMVLDIMN